MLVACRLAGLSALGAHYAGVKWRAIRGPRVAARPSLVTSSRWPLQRRRCKTAIRTALAASTARLIRPPAHATKIGDAHYVIPISRDYCAGDDGTPPAH